MIKKPWFQLLIVILLTFAAYINILNNGFVWDDYEFIVQWELPRSFSNLPEFLKGATPPGHEGVYRPVRNILYAFSFYLFEAQNPLFYHLQGIVLHSLITLLVFFVTKRLTKNHMLSILTALIFGIHPIHTESVSFATVNFDLYGIGFMFISYFLYLKSKKGKNKKFLIFSLIFATLSLFSYELSLPLLLLIISTDFLLFQHNLRPLKKNLVYLLYLIPTAFYFFVRFIILEIPTRTGFLVDSFYYTMLTMTKVFLRYATLLLLPLDLNVIPTISPGITALKADYSAVKSQELINLYSITASILVLIIVFLIFFLRKRHKIASFSLAWMILAFLPFSNIIPAGILFSERYLYVVSFGMSLFIAYWFVYLFESENISSLGKKIVLILLITLLTFYFLRTVTRNNDWENSISLWQNTISRSPDNADMYNNLGIAYSQNEEFNKAIDSFKKAIKLNPYDARYFGNAALNYNNIKQSFNATYYWEKAYSLDPQNEVYAINLAKAYYDNKKDIQALKILMNTRFNKLIYEAHFLTGDIYFNNKNIDKAEEEFKKSIIQKKDYYVAYNGLGSVYLVKKDLPRAESNFKRAISINPNFPPSYNNLALLYVAKGEYELALKTVKQALLLQPDFAEAKRLNDDLENLIK